MTTLAASTKLTYPLREMDFLLRAPCAAVAALLLSAGCTIYSPDLLTGVGGGGTGGNPCVGDGCADSGRDSNGGNSGGPVDASKADGKVADATEDPGPPAMAPYISSTTLSPSIGIGLSNEGTLDWAHWGLKLATDYNRKTMSTPLISLSTPTTRARSQYVGTAPSFVWTDGTPTAMASTTNGIQLAGPAANDGFVVSAPGSVDVRQLRIYLGIFAVGTTLLFKLTSAMGVDAMQTDRLESTTEAWVIQVVTVTFQDANPKSQIAVTFTVDASPAPTTKSAIALAAASLQ